MNKELRIEKTALLFSFLAVATLHFLFFCWGYNDPFLVFVHIDANGNRTTAFGKSQKVSIKLYGYICKWIENRILNNRNWPCHSKLVFTILFFTRIYFRMFLQYPSLMNLKQLLLLFRRWQLSNFSMYHLMNSCFFPKWVLKTTINIYHKKL